MSRRTLHVARGVAWRTAKNTLTNPSLLLPSMLFPLFFFVAFAGGLSQVSEVPGFDYPGDYTAFQFGFVLLQSAAFGGVFTGFSIARDFEGGFGRRLLLASPNRSLNHLRNAIIQSSDVDLGGVTVAKLAEDELYIIRFLTKGRIAPDLTGTDSGGRPMKLSDQKGKVVMLLFWSSSMPEAARVIQIATETVRKFEGRPFAVIGVSQDTVDTLRKLEADGTAAWKNFSDATSQLAREYRVGALPLVYVLDGERRIHYCGNPGSFAELTAEALLSELKSKP